MKLIFLLLPLALTTSAQGETPTEKANAALAKLKQAVVYFYTDCGHFPTTEDGLEALRHAPNNCKGWGPEPYSRLDNDPWNRPWIYESDGKNTFTIKSYGADGREGGIGEDTDIVQFFPPPRFKALSK